jgi:hypothetical protein
MAKKKKVAISPKDMAYYESLQDSGFQQAAVIAATAPKNISLNQLQADIARAVAGAEEAIAESNALAKQSSEEAEILAQEDLEAVNFVNTVASSISSFDTMGITKPGPTLAKDVFIRTLGQFFSEADMTAGWMDELYPVVSGYYKSGIPIDQAINLSLTDARNNPKLANFANRFKGIYAIQDLKASGKPVIVPTIAEYIRSESQVADLFNQAGLSDLANPQGIADVLGKGKAVSQISNEINQVFRRIDLAPSSIKDTLSRYFPTVDRNKLARTILLGEKGLQQLTDELAGLEVLSAAEQQGIGAFGATPKIGGVTQARAQEYARAGITYSTAMPKFAEVRRTAPVEEKLSGISRRQSIGQEGVEQALLLGRAQELEQIENLSEEEIARFRAKSGRLDSGLASQRRANRAF